MNGKPLRLFTCVWGSYLDLFEKALVRSLSWPINRQALQGATWDLCTKAEDFGPAVEIAAKIGIKIELHQIPNDLVGDHPSMGAILLEIFKPCIRRCLDTGSRMLLAPPDTIFGGETVENILRIGTQHDTVVFVAHPRANPTILDQLEMFSGANRFGPNSSVSNAKLVKATWANLHQSWTEAEIGNERINSFVGGVCWRKLGDDLFSIQHMLPTPYLINWVESDLEHFKNPAHLPVFGNIDHIWPGDCVVPKERQRLIGSSDAAFIVEITDAKKNVPPLDSYSKSEPDRFWRGDVHNRMNRQMCVIFRGE